MALQRIDKRNIILFTVMIVAAISFAVIGAFIVKNEEKTQIILEDNFWDIVEQTKTVNYTLSPNQPFQFHEIHVKEKEHSGANNTWIPGDFYSGIYTEAYDENMQPLTEISSPYMISYYCSTRGFIIIVTQMSEFLYSYEVELYSYYQDATAMLWYLFSGFIGIWAICVVLIFVFKRQKGQIKAK